MKLCFIFWGGIGKYRKEYTFIGRRMSKGAKNEKLMILFLAFLLIFTTACNNQKENKDVEKPVAEEEMELEDYLNVERSLKYPEMYIFGDKGKVIEDDSLSKILYLNFSFVEDPGGEKFKDIIRKIF